MARAYGFDVAEPARTAREAIQWLYFAYLAAVKEQNGAAMSLGRTSTFIDIYLERDIAEGTLTEEGAQELVDDFVIKLRLVRFLRTPEYDQLFSGDPDLGHRGDRRNRRRRTTAGDQDQLPLPSDALQPRRRTGTEPHRALVATASRRASSVSARRCRWTRAPSSTRTTTCCGPRSATTPRSPAASQRCGSEGTCSTSAPARTWPKRCSTRSTAAATRSPETRSPRPPPQYAGEVLDYAQVLPAFEHTLDWLARTYVDALNIIHAMHDKYAYERVEMALHDYPVRRFLATGIAGLSVAVDSLSAIKYAQVKVLRDDTGLVTDYAVDGEFPQYGNNDERADEIAVWLVEAFMERIAAQQTYRGSIPTLSVLTITSNVVYGKNTGNTPDGRRAGEPFAPGRQPDERPRPAWHDRLRSVGGEAAVRRGARRYLADEHGHPGRSRPHPRRTRNATLPGSSTRTWTPVATT